MIQGTVSAGGRRDDGENDVYNDDNDGRRRGLVATTDGDDEDKAKSKGGRRESNGCVGSCRLMDNSLRNHLPPLLAPFVNHTATPPNNYDAS